jgi:Domain of unknown function (DUF4292)
MIKSVKKIVGAVKFLTIVMVLTALIASCKSTKKIQAAIAKKDSTSMFITNQTELDSLAMISNLVTEIHSKQMDFKTFSAKIKVEYEDSKSKQSITAYVRMIKDSAIWVSGYATVFNIEAFRALIKKDSVFVIDKINKEVLYRSIDYLQEVSEIPFDFKTLQDLLIGNPIFFDDSVVSYKETESKILLATIGGKFKHLLTLTKPDRLLTHSKLDDLNISRNRTADITYGEFENKNSINFSTYREITVSEKNKLDIQMNYKQYEFNKDLQISFIIPKNFKRR